MEYNQSRSRNTWSRGWKSLTLTNKVL